MADVAIGLRAQKGGAVAVGLTLEADMPRLFVSTFLPTHEDGDRLSFEPYTLAAETPHDAASRVAAGRARQNRIAAENLGALISPPAVVALLVNRAGWVTDLLSYSQAWPEHVPVAEGLAVREALRFAARGCGLALIEIDEKSLLEQAQEQLGLTPEAIDAHLKIWGAAAGRPWRKEQKQACLAAWLALAVTYGWKSGADGVS